MDCLLKNIVIISNKASTEGGAEKVACDSAVYLAKMGYAVTLFAASGPVSSVLLDAGVNVVCLNQDFISKQNNKIIAFTQGLWNIKAQRSLNKLLQEFSPLDTVVNLHSWTHTLSSSVLKSIKDSMLPFVITAHDYFLACPNGGFFNYKENKPCSLRCVNRDCVNIDCDKRSALQKKYRLTRFRIQNRILKNMNLSVIFLSEFSKSVLERSIPFSYVAYSLDNPISFLPGDELIRAEDCQIDCLFVGRIDPDKDCEMFCAAVSNCGLNAVVVGDGQQRDGLEVKYPGVKFVGRVEGDSILQLYRNAKTLVFTSAYYEVAPLVIREAQIAASLPCVVRDGTAGGSYIKDGVTGLLFSYYDRFELESCILRAIDPVVNNKMREAVKNMDFSIHSGEIYVSRLAAIFEDVIKDQTGL